MRNKFQGDLYISESFLAFCMIVIALVVRVIHVFFTAGFNPLAQDLTLDAAIYDRWAKALVWGGDPGPTRLMQAPLYPWFLSLVYRLFGPSLTAVRSIQALLGTGSCAFIIVITRRLFRSSTAGIIAGAAAALYLPSIFYEGVLVPATLILFCNLLFVILMLPENRVPSYGRLLTSGIILGLSVTAKPVAILLLPFAVLHLLFIPRINKQKTSHKNRNVNMNILFFKRSSILAAGLIVSLIPLTIRNTRLTGEFIPLTTGGGINLYIGNNPSANGFYAVPHFRGKSIGGTPVEQRKMMHEIASAEEGRVLSHSEVSRFWFRKGLEFCTDNPGRWAALTWRKFLFFWNMYERANVENLSFHRRFRGILALPLMSFGVVAPLGLLGIFITRSKWRELWLLYGGILAYLAAALIFYVIARYRLPVVPFLLPFAGTAVTRLLKLLRNRRMGEIVLQLAALVLLFYFCNITVARDTPRGISGNLTRLGNAYIARGDTTKAILAYREAVRISPKNSNVQEKLKKLRQR